LRLPRAAAASAHHIQYCMVHVSLSLLLDAGWVAGMVWQQAAAEGSGSGLQAGCRKQAGELGQA